MRFACFFLMERQPVESQTVSSVGYDAATNTLEIEFRGGRIYQYFDVPPDVFGELLMTESKGTFFQSVIRNKFLAKRITNGFS
jgi:hypothetical protein